MQGVSSHISRARGVATSITIAQATRAWSPIEFVKRLVIWAGSRRRGRIEMRAQQSARARSVSQISLRRGPSVPALSVSAERRIGSRLSKDAAHSTRRPSPGPSAISVGIPRTVRLTGAATTLFKTGTASDRVTIKYGRRLSSASAHQISPCWGTFTKVPLLSTRGSPALRGRSPHRSGADVCIPPRFQHRSAVGGAPRQASLDQCALPLNGWRRDRPRPDCPTPRSASHQGELQLAPCRKYSK
jgi:hypothetical protein